MRTEMFVAGQWSTGAASIAVEDPSTGEPIAEVADGSTADALRACDAAGSGAGRMGGGSPHASAPRCCAPAGGAGRHTGEFAGLIVQEHGKPLADATWRDHLRGRVLPVERGGDRAHQRFVGDRAVRREPDHRRHPPVGVVAMITPWNFPAAMITRKLAPPWPPATPS